MKLALFDIDMTLIYSAGAGRRAMTTAIETIFGTNGFDDVSFAGRTDTAILKDGLRQMGVTWEADKEDAFKQLYFERLKIELQKPGSDKGINQGIHEILPNLKKREDVTQALLTGNWQKGAQIKLEYFKLWDYFEFGVFADDSEKRNELPGIAVARLQSLRGVGVEVRDVFVIGDTPLDIACTKPIGAVSVAVATGFYSVDELKAEEPDYLFEDLSDTKAFLDIFS